MRDIPAHVKAPGGRPQGRSQQLSVTAAAAQYGMSRAHLHRLLRRYREGGLDALEPRSRGWPASTLTDNAAVYTSRFTGGRNGFEYLLAHLGIRQKNGSPGHPQTQGKIERFQQTLKRWLERQPAARSLGELQAQLDRFRVHYNEQRPHRATGRITPAEAYAGRPKAHPAGRGAPGHFRLRYDIADSRGAITLRRAGRLHHLKIGAQHARQRVLAIADEHEVTVVALRSGEILSTHRIQPEKGYWRNQRRDPGRWPRSRATD